MCFMFAWSMQVFWVNRSSRSNVDILIDNLMFYRVVDLCLKQPGPNIYIFFNT